MGGFRFVRLRSSRTVAKAECCVRTKHYEAGVRICGAQRILGRAAVHGAVELGRHSLQDQFPALPLGAAVQQATPDPRPGEQGLRKHLVLPASQTRKVAERQRSGGRVSADRGDMNN